MEEKKERGRTGVDLNIDAVAGPCVGLCGGGRGSTPAHARVRAPPGPAVARGGHGCPRELVVDRGRRAGAAAAIRSAVAPLLSHNLHNRNGGVSASASA